MAELNQTGVIITGNQTLTIDDVFDAVQNVGAMDAEDGDFAQHVEVIEFNILVDEDDHTIIDSYQVAYR